MKTILEIKKLSKTYKTQFPFKTFNAVNSISFDIKENEVFGFLGPNGAGKSTTLKMIMNLIKPTFGEIKVMDGSTRDIEVRKKIGFLPENPSFYPFLSAYETLQMICNLYGMDKNIHDDRIRTMLSLVGLKESMFNSTGTFSKGMIQRLGMAQAIINDPELVILDEPMSGLDPIGRKELKDIILMMKRRGKTVLFSSHILPDIEMLADKVCVINKGSIVGIGYVQDIIKRELREIDIEAQFADEIPEELMKFKNEFKFLSIHENKIFITVENEEFAEKISAVIKLKNGRVLSYQPREGKLEEYFMKLMQKDEEVK